MSAELLTRAIEGKSVDDLQDKLLDIIKTACSKPSKTKSTQMGSLVLHKTHAVKARKNGKSIEGYNACIIRTENNLRPKFLIVNRLQPNVTSTQKQCTQHIEHDLEVNHKR